MTAGGSKPIEEDFTEAKNNWELEKLYVNLASAKGKALTPVEKKFLRGLLCGFSPAEIASTVYQSRSSSTVRVYLSNGLYKYIEEMLSHLSGYSVKVKNWSRVTYLLEKAGYKKVEAPISTSQSQTSDEDFVNTKLNGAAISNAVLPFVEDWGEAIDASVFYGRKTELAQVNKWIVEEYSRLVVILGMGGIGKTAFSVRLAEQIKDKFEYVIWRSLLLAPSLELFLAQLIQIFTQQEITPNQSVGSSISQLIECLRSSRCLLVLDNFDSILCHEYEEDLMSRSIPKIKYKRGYEVYGELIRRIGEAQHQSCVILTSREKPEEISAFQGEKLPVRCIKLAGISNVEVREILQAKGLTNLREEECNTLFELYAGNPLFIKLIATAIQELFGGNINEFLEQGIRVFGDIKAVLDKQFNRLSSLEKQIMYWLALHPEPVTMQNIQKQIVPRLSPGLVLEAVELLQRRSLIERQASHFFITPVLVEYIAEQLVVQF